MVWLMDKRACVAPLNPQRLVLLQSIISSSCSCLSHPSPLTITILATAISASCPSNEAYLSGRYSLSSELALNRGASQLDALFVHSRRGFRESLCLLEGSLATRPDLILFVDDLGDLPVKVVVCRVLSVDWLEACIVVAGFGSRGSPTFLLISRMACSIPWSVSGLGMQGPHSRKFIKEEISRTT
jgi:hypothetical protein